jgi:rare lipoprotein A
MDVSSRVADALDFKGAGTARVKVEYIGKASLEGSDDSKLLATLRVDGAPATLDGVPGGAPVMVASSILAPVESLTSALSGVPARPRPAPPPPAAPVAAVAEQVEEAPAEPMRQLPALAPTPPSRPFDLGTIPDAAVPVRAPTPPVRTSAIAPARPQAPATDEALYFSDSATLLKFMKQQGPFDRLISPGVARSND